MMNIVLDVLICASPPTRPPPGTASVDRGSPPSNMDDRCALDPVLEYPLYSTRTFSGPAPEAGVVAVRDIICNTSFSDAKKNTVISGTFTKIIFSTSYMTTAGLYIRAPFVIHARNRLSKKTTVYFSKSNVINSELIYALGNIESQILHKFRHANNSHKYLVFSLRDALSHSNIKLFEDVGEPARVSKSCAALASDSPECHMSLPDPQGEDVLASSDFRERTSAPGPTNRSYIIRISGVWESENSIGIIYKFLESTHIA